MSRSEACAAWFCPLDALFRVLKRSLLLLDIWIPPSDSKDTMTRTSDVAHWHPRDILLKTIPGGLIISLLYIFLVYGVRCFNLRRRSNEGDGEPLSAYRVHLQGKIRAPKISSIGTTDFLDGIAVLSFKILRHSAVLVLVAIQSFQISNASGGKFDLVLLLNYVSKNHSLERTT